MPLTQAELVNGAILWLAMSDALRTGETETINDETHCVGYIDMDFQLRIPDRMCHLILISPPHGGEKCR